MSIAREETSKQAPKDPRTVCHRCKAQPQSFRCAVCSEWLCGSCYEPADHKHHGEGWPNTVRSGSTRGDAA